MIANSDRKQVVSAPQFSEAQRRMSWRCRPQLVILFSKALNLNWQFRKKAPELLRDPRR
jgi:hypothetical protein